MKTTTINIDGAAVTTGEDDIPTEQDFETAIQNMIDIEAMSRGFDSILTAVSYAGYVNDDQANAVILRDWRSAVWKASKVIRADVNSGARTQPTIQETLDELKALLIT